MRNAPGLEPVYFRYAMRGRGLSVLLAVLLSFFCPFFADAAEVIPLPGGLSLPGGAARFNEASGIPPDSITAAFLGVPYRNDGAINESGQYTLFSDQEKIFQSPGLNCSGLVLGMWRFLLGKNITLDAAMRDRLGDSGPGAAGGEDWDFGWDLILNISEGLPRRFLLPGGAAVDPAHTTGLSPRGYDIQSEETWTDLPPRLKPGSAYLVSLNVEGRRKGYGLQHYHVGLIYMANSGEAWFYQTTGKGGGVNRRNLKSAQGRESFKRAFGNTGQKRKMMLVLEVDLPRK